MTNIRIDVDGLCPKCIKAAMRQPAQGMFLFGYFMWAAAQEFEDAGEVPTLDGLSDVAFLAAAQYMYLLPTAEAIEFRTRFDVECGYADQADVEDIMYAIRTPIGHGDDVTIN